METDKLYVERLKESGLNVKETSDRAILLNFKESMSKQTDKGEIKTKGQASTCQALLDQLKGFVRNTIGKDQSLIQAVIKAYHSAISSYASNSLRDKKIFNYKEVNLTDLVKLT
jgi:hypothetical protein